MCSALWLCACGACRSGSRAQGAAAPAPMMSLTWLATQCFARALLLGHPEAPAALASLRRAAVIDSTQQPHFVALQKPTTAKAGESRTLLADVLDLVELQSTPNDQTPSRPYGHAGYVATPPSPANTIPGSTSDDVTTWALHVVAALQHGSTDTNLQSRVALGYRHQQLHRR